MSGIVEAVSGDGRMGRVGLVSTLNDLISEEASWTCCCPACVPATWCARAR